MEEIDFLDAVHGHLLEIKLKLQKIENDLSYRQIKARRMEKENNELAKELTLKILQ